MDIEEAIEVLKIHKDRDDLGSKVYEAIDTVIQQLEKPLPTVDEGQGCPYCNYKLSINLMKDIILKKIF